jgi:hypothetical protein
MNTLHQMSELLAGMDKNADGRAAFLRCYSMMSQNMVSAVDESAFNDPEWMRRLIDHFAWYYFQALEKYDREKHTTPMVWSLAHDTACQGSCSILQKLLLGINAHINYDLVLALTDLMDEEWKKHTPSLRNSRFEDYCKVNEIIGQTVDSVQDLVLETHSPSMELLDIAMGKADEWLISRLIRSWRDEVWERAGVFLENTDPAARQQLRDQLEERTLTRADAILLKKGWRSLAGLW